MDNFKNKGVPTLKGNTCLVDNAIEVIKVVMEGDLLVGRDFH